MKNQIVAEGCELGLLFDANVVKEIPKLKKVYIPGSKVGFMNKSKSA